MSEAVKITLEAQFAPFLNLALHQRKTPILESLKVINHGDALLEDLIIVFSCADNFILQETVIIPEIGVGATYTLPPIQLQLQVSYLAQLTEKEINNINISITYRNETIFQKSYDVTLMPFDYFGGFRYYPESIANYVTPNHPYVFAIKQKTSAIMEANKMSPSFTGYQMDRADLVYKTLGALYQAVQQEDIIYSSLPPSFEESGQRLRLLDSIQQLRFANCIDLSLLFAACLEAMDLHPIIIITQGHAFVGCWLHEEKFATIINDDRSAITKRFVAGIREIAVFEATAVCKGNKIDFNSAVNAAENQLVGADNFLLSIDIKKARVGQYLPLPLKINLQNNLEYAAPEQSEYQPKRKDKLSELDLGNIYQEEDFQPTTITKEKIWERKLLDLSLRNNLLSLTMSRNYVQLIDIDLDAIEDQLADGKSFSIQPIHTESNGVYNRFLEPIHSSHINAIEAQDEFKHKRLLSYYGAEDLEVCLNHMYRNAKSAIEENGSSTLYLALGILRWNDLNTPERKRYAPILLVPVELSRRSVKSKFTLKSREEDTVINITLLEYLKQEYELDLNFLEELPQDEKGIDTRKVFTLLRRAIMEQKNWDIEEQLILGNFSFNKLILWKDIVNNKEQLRQNPIVKGLIEGKLAQTPNTNKTIQANELDAKIHPKNTIIPIPADVSQLQAIIASNNNESYVLHGPPGTGKSQTITNIIANALYNNKRVLFVSAKKAALDVVYKRLENIGLAPYCLELHSNKTKKSETLAYFERTLSINKLYSNLNFENNSEQLYVAQNELNNLVSNLHKPQNFGKSIYECILECENLKGTPSIDFKIPGNEIQALYPQRLQQWLKWIDEYSIIASKVENTPDKPLQNIELQHYPYNIEQKIKDSINTIFQQTEVLNDHLNKLNNQINTSDLNQNKANLSLYFNFLNLCVNIEEKWSALMAFIWENRDADILISYGAHFNEFLNIQDKIDKKYHPDIVQLKIDPLELEYNQAQASWFLPQFFKLRKIKKTLQPYFKNGKIQSEFITDILSEVRAYQKAKTQLDQPIFESIKSTFNKLQIQTTKQVNEAMAQIGTIEATKSALERIQTTNGTSWLKTIKNNGIADFIELLFRSKEESKCAIQAYQSLINLITDFKALTNYNESKIEENNNYTKALVTDLGNITNHLHHLRDWTHYQQVIQEAKALGISNIINSSKENINTNNQLNKLIKLNLYSNLTLFSISQLPNLQKFDKTAVEQAIQNYVKLEKQQSNIAQLELHNLLVKKLPNSIIDSIANSELGILQRNIRNKGRGTSLRRLFDQIPQLLPRLAPCMLMSPISVAQYFTMQPDLFDLVIFDEASQLPTCEAVGALARAKNAIIVGDPKQMPPTSFFSTNKIDDDNIDLEDLDSILDDSLALSIPSRYLLKHYRSQHESLIAFSNVQYYDSKLLTFPSADDLQSKVLFHKIEGSYDKGKSRQNKIEALAIVADIERRLSDSNTIKQSIGVVTFSQTQQTLIEDELQKLFYDKPEIEAQALQMKEPIFVKNLENVQGDERDVILFSIGYGPDKNGTLSMNFGPLNRDGGWRRLNVAVTRARAEMHIFSTITADQIDLRRTNAEGVLGLKAFLEFAEKGHLADKHKQPTNQQQIDLNSIIAERLKQEGLDVVTNIGNSDSKLDLGIIHPKEPNTYILGIIVDGLNYYNASTTNDRELVAPNVLQRLGWNLYKVWTLDWHINADSIIEDIKTTVNTLLTSAENPKTNSIPIKEDITSQTYALEEKTTTTKHQEYQFTPLSNPESTGADAFLSSNNKEIIKNQILKITQNEAPISFNLLSKRLMDIWGIARKGNRTTLYLLQLIGALGLEVTNFEDQSFVWSFKTLPHQIDFYRSSDVYKRSLEDIAPEEITVAILESIEQHITVHKEDLIKYINKAFGNTKITEANALYIAKIIDRLLAQQHLSIENDLLRS